MDVRLLFLTRTVRMFGYGGLGVILALYLAAIGLDDRAIGLLLTLTLVGDALISLWITTRADRIGRRRMLVLGAGLMLLGGLAFGLTSSLPVLLIAATIGVLSPSGNEVGPFLAIEQAALADSVDPARRTALYGRYHLAGSLATALGALAGGGIVRWGETHGWSPLAGYRTVLFGYAALGLVLAVLFPRLSPAIEPPRAAAKPSVATRFGLHRSRSVVTRLSALFALDAFAGGFVVQSLVALWFNRRFGTNPAALGAIFFGANLLSGFSALVATRVARRVGLLRTMVFTHVPSNLLLLLVPLMPTFGLAVLMLLLRFAISQMDVPARQSYTAALVSPDERSAAAGVTGIARTMGAALAPVLAGMLLSQAALAGAIFVAAGGLKLGYDLLLYRTFRDVRLDEERVPAA